MNDQGVVHRRGRWRRHWEYWHYGADVYPDGSIDRWRQHHKASGYVTIPAVDDHLNNRDEPWDGHTQGHCGEHISIFGTDRASVSRAFAAALKASRARADGACHSRLHRHEGDIDGKTVYEAAWMKARRAGTGKNEELQCMHRFDHEWKEPGEWREVSPGNFNRTTGCKHCFVWSIEGRFTVTFPPSDPIQRER